jgi:hypothetical protein
MNKRERFLLFVLLGLLIVVGGWALYYFVYQKPMDALNARMELAKKDLDTKEREKQNALNEIEQTKQRNPHLREWKKISLPEAKLEPGKTRTPDEVEKHTKVVQADYQEYLHGLLFNNGFLPASINITPQQPDSKGSPVIAGRGPVYTKLAYKVKGQAKLSSVVAMLKHFYEDNLLQEVHMLSITKPGTARQGASPDDLEIDMDVQALLVKDAEARTTLKPTFADKTAPSMHPADRSYDDILKKNFFTGLAIERALKEDPKEVLSAVRLTTVYWNGRRWEANFYDELKGPKRDAVEGEKWEVRVNADTVQTLKVEDRYQHIVLDAKVVKVDDRLVVIQANGKYYKLTTGDNLHVATEKPLKDSEVKELGLTPLAAAEPEKAKVVKTAVEKSPAEESDPPSQ